METDQISSSDEQSLFESTLEQVISFRRHRGSVIDHRSVWDLDVRHYKEEINYPADQIESERERTFRFNDLSVNNEVIQETPYGKFSAIDFDESILPYSRAVKAGNRDNKNVLNKIEEINSESSEDENYKHINNISPFKSEGPSRVIQKEEVEMAMIQNSASKERFKKVKF